MCSLSVGAIVVSGPFQNQGFGTDALNVLIRFIRQHVGLRKTKLRVYGCLRIQRAGTAHLSKTRFPHRGTLSPGNFFIFRRGGWHDVLEMGLFSDDEYPVNVMPSIEE